MDLKKMPKPRFFLALTLAAALCLVFMLSPLANANAEQPDYDDGAASIENGAPEVPPEDADPLPTEPEPEPDVEPGPEPEAPQPAEAGDEGGDEAGNGDNGIEEDDTQDTGPEEPSHPEFVLPEYDPQPADAEEAFTLWQAALAGQRTVMWEFELPEDCIPEGARQEFVLLDEESGTGYWTLYMNMRAMAAVTKTVSNATQLQSAIDAAAAGDVLTLTISAGFDMTESIVIDKSLTISIIGNGPVMLHMTESYVRHFDIQAGTVKLYFRDVELNGLVPGSDKGGGFNVRAGADVYLSGVYLTEAATGPVSSGHIPGGALYVAGRLEIADSYFNMSDGFDEGGIAYVAPGATLVISGTASAPVRMRCGNATTHGGGIYVEAGGTLQAQHLQISSGINNPTGGKSDVGGRAATAHGGGIYWSIAPGTGEQYLKNSIIQDSSGTFGGGVYINILNGGKLEAFDNNLINNNTSNYFGGVYLLNNGTVNSFNGNTITNNSAKTAGAAIYAGGTAGFTVTNTTISNHRGTSSIRPELTERGAAIYSVNPALVIDGENTQITNNFASIDGGAVYVAAGKTTFLAGTISGNTTDGAGGGVYVAAGATFKQAGGAISGNTAVGDGGGVYVAEGASFVQTGGSIAGNKGSTGGGIYVGKNATAELAGGAISGNTTSMGGGLGVYNFGLLEISGATITGHEANGKNGTVMLASGAKATMSGGEISGNTITGTGSAATGNGAGLYVNSNAFFTMTGGAISGNRAVNGAGVYVAKGNEVIVTGGSISSNTASGLGGGFYLEQGNELIFRAEGTATISTNTAPAGGAVYSDTGNTISLAQNGGSLLFDGNNATDSSRGGGAFYLNKNTVLAIYGGSFTNNTATGDGGALYLFDASVTASVQGGSFGAAGNGNTANGDGGAIFNSAGTLSITAGRFEANSAGSNGGAISSTYGKNTFAGAGAAGSGGTSEPYITGNTAALNGGGVYVADGILGMKNTALENNKAQYGGGMYVAVGGLYDSLGASPFAADTIEALDGNLMAGNEAYSDGGGMYVYVSANGVSESISGNQFSGNTAGRNGGGLYVAYYGEGKRVSGNTVSGNHADGNGGGLYVEGTMARYFAITDDTVQHNTADGNGGGVYVHNTILRVYDASALGVKGKANITNNKATNGGGIYASGYAKVVVEQGTLSGNQARANGGGIYSNVYLAPEGTLSASTDIYKGILVDIGVASLTGNTAAGNGGGVYVGQRGALNLAGTALAQNTAANGGGVYIATFGMLDINKTASGAKTSFTGNIARTGNGGGLYVGNGTLSLQYALLTGNKAENGNGGGAYVVLQADEGGSGEAQMIIYNEFKQNEALNGGGLHITIKDGATSRVVGGNLLEGNKAVNGNGGGVWISFSGEGKSVYFNTIQGNTALRGGGVYVTGTSKTGNNMSFTNDKILKNTATEVGGGIMVDNSTLTLFDAEATNAAKVVIDGKLVEYNMLDGSPIMGHTLIEGNSAPNGGGIFLNNSILYLQNGVINKNTATYNGGGINASAGSVILNYDPYKISPEYRLVVTNNAATNGDGGGMYIVPQEDLPQQKRQYELSGLTVQGNKALNGDGGGIYADKPLLKYLHIENSTFGDPDKADAALYNEASTYVTKLDIWVDAIYIPIHGANLSALHGLSPHGNTWAEVSDQDNSPLYYNNYDIAFHTVPPDSATVTYHGNGGYFADQNNTSRYSEDVLVGRSVEAPKDTKHNNASFVGWYDDAQTITDILDKALAPSAKLSVINGALGYETTAEEAVDFYAAWLPPPMVDPAYDNDTEVVVYTLQNITEVSLTVNGATQTLSNGYKVEDGLWKWTFTVSGLAAGMPLEAIQTITVPGGASTVDSPEGKNTVLPTHRVIYHINAPEESSAEQGRLDADWKPTDDTPYRSSEDVGIDAVVLAPQAGAAGRTNYKFLGWQASGSGKILKGGDTVTVYDEDVHLYAQWEPMYTLTYDANISINLDKYLPDDATKPRGTPVYIDPWKDETDPMHPGYRFQYWTNDRAGNSTAKYLDIDSIPKDSTFDYDASLVLNQNRTLFAKWVPLYQVTYELNYEGAPPSDIIDAGYYAQNEDLFPVSTEVPQREGYTFTGWHYYQNPAQDENKWYTPGEAYLMDEPGITLYAQWERNLTIRYDGNGHTGGDAPAGETSWPYRAEYTIEGHNTLQRDGYNFLGWALAADATEPDYRPMDLFYPTENIVFYAVWTTQTVPPIIHKQADVVLVGPGDTFSYTLVVLNNNSALEVEAVVVDTLPGGLTLVESDTPYTQNGQTVTFTKTMPPESVWTIHLTVKLDDAYTGSAVHNIATVIFDGDEALADTDFELTPLRPVPPAPEPIQVPPEPPAPEPPAPTPKTGDESYIALWVCLAVVSFGGMCGLMVVHALYRRRRLRERYKWYYRAGGR